MKPRRTCAPFHIQVHVGCSRYSTFVWGFLHKTVRAYGGPSFNAWTLKASCDIRATAMLVITSGQLKKGQTIRNG